MMTPDDGTAEGSTKPGWFPARPEVIEFCEALRAKRDVAFIQRLPRHTGAEYSVKLHRPYVYISRNNRAEYF